MNPVNLYALLSVAFVSTALLVGLVLVLRHLAAMRATTSEITDLRAQWAAGSKGIAESAAAGDSRVAAMNTQLVRISNKLGLGQ